MGSIHSYISPEISLAAFVATTFLAFGYVRYTTQQAPETALTPKPAFEGSRKNKKKSQSEGDTGASSPSSVAFAAPTKSVIPGGFAEDAAAVDTDSAVSKPPTKPKKKRGKKASAGGAGSTPTPADNQSEGSSAAAESSKQPSSRKRPSGSAEQVEAWTRVESRRRQKPLTASEVGEGKSAAELTSDAGVTTSVTGNSSPATERTEDETDPASAPETRKTLAEKMLPKPRKTGVEDMLEKPDYPGVARVMRIQPRPDEKPAPGFTWADYEDVHAAEDADGEDDGGWGVVKSRGRPRPDRPQQQQATSQQTALETKKQRQNAARRAAEKAEKASAEAERLSTLARHKKELEAARIAEQYSQKSGKKGPGGGASASVDDRGHLVWD